MIQILGLIFSSSKLELGNTINKKYATIDFYVYSYNNYVIHVFDKFKFTCLFLCNIVGQEQVETLP